MFWTEDVNIKGRQYESEICLGRSDEVGEKLAPPESDLPKQIPDKYGFPFVPQGKYSVWPNLRCTSFGGK